MSDYYWQHASVTPLHIDYVYQVKYTIHHFTNALFEVKQTNLYNDETDHRVYLPQRYHDLLRKFIWRGDILMTLYRKYHKRPPKIYKQFIGRLPKIIVHLDNVIEALLRPAVGLSVNQAEDYRSPNFEEFLITEFLLGRHDPSIVQEYREAYDVNIERLNAEDLDWDSYDDLRVNSMFEGSQFSYDVEQVDSNELKTLLGHAKQHFARAIDHDWVSTWLETFTGEPTGDGSGSDSSDTSTSGEEIEEAPSASKDMATGAEDDVAPMDVVSESKFDSQLERNLK